MINNNVPVKTPYVRTSRSFPTELKELSREIDRTYIDIAAAINLRTVGVFTSNVPSITGNTYSTSGSVRQSLRQIYTFGAIAASASATISSAPLCFNPSN